MLEHSSPARGCRYGCLLALALWLVLALLTVAALAGLIGLWG